PGGALWHVPPVIPIQAISLKPRESTWHKIRGGVMFAAACALSPCCTPLVVPLALALLAGTPVALWLNAHLGAIYAVHTLLRAVSLVRALRWPGQKKSKPAAKVVAEEPAVNTIHIELNQGA